MLKYISNTEHYSDILVRCKDVKHTLWIGTADIKDAYFEVNGEKMPFLKLLAQLIRKGVEIRLIHAKEPAQHSKRILINFLCFLVALNEYFALEFISK